MIRIHACFASNHWAPLKSIGANGSNTKPKDGQKSMQYWNHLPILADMGIGQSISKPIITILSGWWLTYTSEKYEFVSWDD